MTAQDNKTLVRRLYAEVWNQGNLDAAEELCDAGIVYHGPGDPTCDGLRAFKEYVTACRTIFPDLCFDAQELIAEEDQVAVRWVLHGTHAGQTPLLDLALTGKQVELQGVTFHRIGSGRLTEGWVIRESATSKVTS